MSDERQRRKKLTMRNRGGRGTRDETVLRDRSEELKGNREKSFPLSNYDMHVIFYISVGVKSGVESVRERARKEEGGNENIEVRRGQQSTVRE